MVRDARARQRARRHLEKPAKPRVFISGPCARCGEAFTALHADSRYCSLACRKRARWSHRERRRRALISTGRERVEPRKVFERDGWICRICREPVDQDAKVPDPKAPTIDHILPLSLEGEDVYSNVQTAHFICNSTKGANVTQLSFAA